MEKITPNAATGEQTEYPELERQSYGGDREESQLMEFLDLHGYCRTPVRAAQCTAKMVYGKGFYLAVKSLMGL